MTWQYQLSGGDDSVQGAEFMLLSTAPTEAREGIGSTVNGIVDHHVGARNQNQVFQKSSQYSYLLSHLSSPHTPFLPSQIFTVGVRCQILCDNGGAVINKECVVSSYTEFSRVDRKRKRLLHVLFQMMHVCIYLIT